MGRYIVVYPFNDKQYTQSDIIRCIHCYKMGFDVDLTHLKYYNGQVDSLYGNTKRFDFMENYITHGNEKLSFMSTNRIGLPIMFDDSPLEDLGEKCVDIGCIRCLSWLGWKLTEHETMSDQFLLLREAII